jgi:hypothetical protein
VEVALGNAVMKRGAVPEGAGKLLEKPLDSALGKADQIPRRLLSLALAQCGHRGPGSIASTGLVAVRREDAGGWSL